MKRGTEGQNGAGASVCDRPPSYVDFLRAQFGGRNFVLARRTASIVERYGADVICVSKAQYRTAEHAWRELYGDPYDAVRAELYQAAKAIEAERPTNTEHDLWYRLRAAVQAEAAAK